MPTEVATAITTVLTVDDEREREKDADGMDVGVITVAVEAGDAQGW